MFGTYKPEDVTVLLKDISGLVTPMTTPEREARIQSGVHYCEMLPVEYEPSKEYLKAYYSALEMFAKDTARAVGAVGSLIWQEKGKDAVLVSLARAGTPVGILIKRYIKQKYGAEVSHYTISIIRGKGIDKNAMRYILARHSPEKIQFVDGWIGKGAIGGELSKAMEDFPGVDSSLAVLCDPAYITAKCGTRDDILIASSCLNSTVSGLLSRTFLRADIIGENDFHGAAFYENLADRDLTYQFIEAVEREFSFDKTPVIPHDTNDRRGLEDVREICEVYNIKDVNLVKPGIGEATRVLLRRLPWKVLVHSLDDFEHLGHIYRLAKEKNAELQVHSMKYYRACGIIKSLADN